MLGPSIWALAAVAVSASPAASIHPVNNFIS
jgi:hypothetical protein